MATLKLKISFEIEEQDLKDLLESYDVKPTKANLARLKRDIKESGAIDDFSANLSSDIENEIGEWINNMDWENEE